jgi:signal transduction histidine kinase
MADGAEHRTDHGLVVLAVPKPVCPALHARKPDAFWIDFPLLAIGRPVGKWTLDCPAEYRPEDLAFLKVLCEIVGEMLVARAQWEQVFEKELGDNTTRALREMFHHVRTTLASLDPILSDYRRLAHELTGEPAKQLRDQNDLLDRAYAQIDRLVQGTRNRLLTYVSEWRRADLAEVVRSAFAGFAPPIDWALNGADPAAAPAVEMDMDRPRLESALVQLVHNARSCHPEPARLRVSVTVAALARLGQPWVQLAVADNGPGVPHEIRDRLFEPFISRRLTGTQGTGFGLFFVRRVVGEHGGTVRLDLDYQGGACFVVEVPRYRNDPTPPANGPAGARKEPS